ncbi:actin-like ATPase domain-containing protein [Tuber magnatum]|uniref:Actin-like ATPase domain-containing protein n=1 Tax=Tuber magnatum TaxID=42249 RepID=A0A317SGN9_9PEZI|nr:actin-like ATPase domain-containing protein [Tuber magnatum]
MAPPKKSGRALLREEGLERTDNNLRTHSWPVIPMINQKNYYTEYLKREDQIMVFRQQQEDALKAQAALLEKEKQASMVADPMAMDIDRGAEEGEETAEQEEALGSKVVVIHTGSQNMRIGLASDALPKTFPNCIARKADKAEYEEEERCPKRMKVAEEDEDSDDEGPRFGEEFETQFNTMSNELKVRMRHNKRRILPNSRDLVLSYNHRTPPETIKEHNDPYRVEWTDTGKNRAPDHFVGNEALRIPDNSTPRYRLFWPIQYGTFNERDYQSKRRVLEDISVILEEGIERELNIEKKDLRLYSAVLVVPDLYDKNYVTEMLNLLLKEFWFAQVCIIQESLAATFGAGFSQACIVDIGAQKTSICCVEEGMCVAESRLNLKYGGQDVTIALMKMMLSYSFPYRDINLWRRYDFLLAEELKAKYATLNDSDISVQAHDFHLRAPEQDTKKYHFKTYDEVMLAPLTHFKPTILSHEEKLTGRRSLWERSYDLYDGQPNDPLSTAQQSLYQSLIPRPPSAGNDSTANMGTMTPARPTLASFGGFGAHLAAADTTPRSSIAGSPAPEGTPAPPGTTTPLIPGPGGIPHPGSVGAPQPTGPTPVEQAEDRDRVVPIMPLDAAIVESITHAAKGEEKKIKDFLASIMVVGGGSLVSGFNHQLEERIRALKPSKEYQIIIGVPPRELDPMVIVWKGASVFGKLKMSNDSWIRQNEYDMLGSRLLTYKCLWTF